MHTIALGLIKRNHRFESVRIVEDSLAILNTLSTVIHDAYDSKTLNIEISRIRKERLT